jgi:hypothetical protein
VGIDESESTAGEQLEWIEVVLADNSAEMETRPGAVTRRAEQRTDGLPGRDGIADFQS